MACVLLALYGFMHLGSATFSTIATAVMIVDAYIGFYLFVKERHEDIGEYLTYFKKTVNRPMAQKSHDSDANLDNAFVKI